MRHGLKDLIGESRLVNPPSYSIPHIRIGISGSSVWHGGDLVLNA